MSRLVDFQNRIRRRFRPEWLSLSQKQTYDHLKQLLSFQNTVNLYGPSGVGKTFLVWVLGQEVSTCFYFFNLKQLEGKATDQTTIAVVDPHPWQRSIVRQTLSTLHGLGYKKILLVSQEPVADQIPSCQLSLNQSDLVKIYQNWSEVSIPVDELPESFESINLHAAIREIALQSLATPKN
jgi:hypothetical protein